MALTVVKEKNDKISGVFNLGLGVLVKSDVKKMQYLNDSLNDSLDGSVENLINYAGQVTRFQSLFLDFIESVTTEMNGTKVPLKMVKDIQKIMPGASVSNLLEFSVLIRRSVQDYSIVVLKSMLKLKDFPTKVKKLSKIATMYERMGRELIPVKKLERLFTVEEVKEIFTSLENLSNQGFQLANYFFDMYQKNAPLSKDLKDYIQKKNSLNTALELAIKKQGEIMREKIIEEAKFNFHEGFKTMYEEYVTDLSDSSTNKKAVWEKIVDTGIQKAKTEKQQAEDRLRKYTFRMYGVFTSWWVNDVAQARVEVRTWSERLDKLTEEKKNGFQDDVEEKIKSYKTKIVEAEVEVKKYQGCLINIIEPKLQEVRDNITHIKEEIKAEEQRKNKLFEGMADARASAERLIDAIDATNAFAVAAVQQAFTQTTFQTAHESEFQKLLFNLEDLFEEGVSLDEQKILLEGLQESIEDTPLLTFLNNVGSLLTYPTLNRAEIQAIDQQLNTQLLITFKTTTTTTKRQRLV